MSTDFRFDVRGKSFDDIKKQTEQQLEDFAPGREWVIATDVSTNTVFAGDGTMVVIDYEASVHAILRERVTR